jgi:parallel beta-helix repeat protein
VSNCVITGNYTGASGGTLYNCTLTDNSGDGGAYGCTLHNCTVTGNTGGSGASGCTLYNCTLSGNEYGGAWGSTLYNCTLTGNAAGGAAGGGGADGCTMYNCTLAGNQDGGAANSTLYNCTLTSNSASGVGFRGFGGGALRSTLYNCTLTGNSAVGSGGGAYISTLYNCIVYFNTASGDANYDASCILNYCCTIPIPTNGVENITNSPLFVDYANGNLRLQSNSPCINAGNNAYVTTATDLDGNPRIVSGTVDVGAYEYQGPGSVISYAWLQRYSLPTDGSADYADPDHDGLNDWQEWICGTNPTNALSALRMVSAVPTSTNTTVAWQSVTGVSYFLERSADLAAPFTLLATNIVGRASTTTYADTNATGAGPFFYRVGVAWP